jgi:hypothetical protein
MASAASRYVAKQRVRCEAETVGNKYRLRYESETLIETLRPCRAATVPTAQNLNAIWLVIDAVKHLKIFLHNEAPDCGSLA